MFHVPEASRLTMKQHPALGSDASYGNNGAFQIVSPESGWHLFMVCSDGSELLATGTDSENWEHVSVHARNNPNLGDARSKLRTPTWKEMCFVKKVCWDGEDVVVQFHPKESEYVNCHPYTLHLWRWKAGEFPRPDRSDVG
jgi:hypothetical protein